MLENRNQLVIPMHINGLYIDNDHNYQTIDCLDCFHKYKNTPLGISMENQNNIYYEKMNKGIYLHWVLPEAMRQGSHDGETIFPHIPNRYHVIRIVKDQNQYCVKTIVIESNALDVEGAGKVSTLVQEAGKLKYAYLGKSYEYQKRTTPAQDYLSLSSLGYGDPAFSAYYTKTQNILSYYDNLKDMTSFEELWYLVVGYYEEAEFDPFLEVGSQAELDQALEGLNWTLQGAIEIPVECLMEGIIRIQANKKTVLNDHLSLCVGQNIVEALSTCCDFPRDLQRLCYNHLNDPFHIDSLIKQEAMNHQLQFDKVDADDIYTIADAQFITEADAMLLDQINLLQRQICQFNYKITSLRQDGFTLWYKYHEVLIDWFKNDDEKQEAYDIYYRMLKDVYQKIENYQSARQIMETDLNKQKQYLKNIKLIKDQPYWISKNPTLLIQSDQTLRNYQYGFDQRQENISLQCRSRSQLLKTDQDITIVGYYDLNLKDFILETCIYLDNLNVVSGEKPVSIMVNNNETAWQYVSMLWEINYLEDTDKQHWILSDDDFLPIDLKTKPGAYVVDRSIMTPHAENLIKASLKKYHEVHSDEQSQQLLSNMGNVDMLSQTMGTFNEQLRAKKSTYQIPIEKFEKGFYNGSDYEDFYKLSYKIIQDQNQLSIISNNIFHCMRSGKMKIEKVQLIDTFSRIRDVDVKNINISESLDEDNEIVLPPRILQPSRLLFDFGDLDRYSSVYPVIGWIRYNYMNQSLIIYSKNGEYIGELKLIKEKLQFINTIQFQIDNDLNTIIQLLQEHAQNFSQFLNVIEKRQANMKECIITEEDIAMYIGHPLALIKAHLTLEVQGEPIRDDCWCEGKESLSPLINYDFQVRIGDQRSHSDGLVGFFLNNTFHQPFETNEFMKNNEIILHIDQRQELVMLMNIYLESCMTTGLLPKKVISLSRDKYKNIIQSMNCSLLLGPSLQPSGSYILPLDKLNCKFWQLNNTDIEISYPETLQTYYIYEGYLKMNRSKKE